MRLSLLVSRCVAMGNIRGARDCWNGAVRPGRDFRGHRLVGHRSRYSRIAHSYISRSDDVVSMRTMKHAWSGPRFFALAQRNGTPLRAAIIDEMDRDLVGHLPIICVARNRSFLAAALELGMSPSAISHAVRNVEGPTDHSIMCGTNHNRKA